MMIFLKQCLLILIGFSAGVVVSGGIFGFIAVLGVIPRMAQRTKTEDHIPLYEDAVTLGGLFGVCSMFLRFRLPFGILGLGASAFAIGVFEGVLAVSLSEVLNVIPIFMRRTRLTQGLSFFILSMAIGKGAGALLYALVPGFFEI